MSAVYILFLMYFLGSQPKTRTLRAQSKLHQSLSQPRRHARLKSTVAGRQPCRISNQKGSTSFFRRNDTIELPTKHLKTAPASVELRDMTSRVVEAEEPLMGRVVEDDRASNIQADIASAAQDSSQAFEQNLQRPGLFVWLLTLSAGISGLLFGYDTGVISATLVSIGSSLSGRPLTTLDKSLITACTSLFALIVSPTSGLLADSLGRKKVILLADGFFVLGAAIQAFSGTVWSMIVGRSIVGLAVGAASFAVPLYIAELAPAKFRGSLVTLNVLFITLGQVVAYVIGWGFAESGGLNGWRWMVGLGLVPAGVQNLVMLAMPESPRWLVKVQRVEEAMVVLRKVYRPYPDIQHAASVIIKEIEKEVQEEEQAKRGRIRRKDSTSWFPGMTDTCFELFGVPGNRRALTIACLLQGLQQLCGFNSLMYFSATLFSLIGFSTPTLTSLSVATTNLIFTVLSLLVIDSLGRRRILLLSVPVMVFALLSCAFAFHFINLPSNINVANLSTASSTPPGIDSYSPFFVVASIILYVAAYAVGIGCIPWQQSELFPLSVRSVGSAISTATNWGSNFLVGATFLPLLEQFSPTLTFILYASVCSIGWVLIWLIYPETAGLGLEETGDLLRNGWGVGKSLERRRDQQHVQRLV